MLCRKADCVCSSCGCYAKFIRGTPVPATFFKLLWWDQFKLWLKKKKKNSVPAQNVFFFNLLPRFPSCKFVTGHGRLNPFPCYEYDLRVLCGANAANANAASAQRAHSLSIIVSCQSNLDKVIICLMPNIELIWAPLIGLWGGKREGVMGLEKTTVSLLLSDGNSCKSSSSKPGPEPKCNEF